MNRRCSTMFQTRASSVRILLLFVAVSFGSGCLPLWTGNRMEKDIEQLKSEQAQLTESLRQKEAELTEMISSARADVSQLNSVIKDATELLQRNSADFGAEMEQMREEVQSVRGEAEQAAFKLQKLEQVGDAAQGSV